MGLFIHEFWWGLLWAVHPPLMTPFRGCWAGDSNPGPPYSSQVLCPLDHASPHGPCLTPGPCLTCQTENSNEERSRSALFCVLMSPEIGVRAAHWRIACPKPTSRFIAKGRLHCKKRLSIFPPPAGMSLSKLSLSRNN